jgi:flagellar basal-body rod protein FlgG
MIDALYISATGLRSQQEQIDVISNNVANLQTPGFKKSRISFAEVAGTAPADGSLPTSAGGGTRILSTAPVFSAGEYRATHNETDLAIDGDGFFELETELGEKVYTRAGQFRIDNEGVLVSASGLRLAQSLQFPAGASEVRIAPTGEVSALLAGETERTEIGVIELAVFPAGDGLEAVGENNFAPTELSGAATFGKPGDPGFGQVQQGFLEMANVDMVDEMANLMLAQRAYQLNARVLQAADQVMETINNLRR